ncbi:MAG: DUF11 domain-containing protein, partial [Acidobacteriota bacterium]|nr:DUF11 domain-containing protein [Acidobacteriota bacterium]
MSSRRISLFAVCLLPCMFFAAAAQAALTVTPITWDVIGLDSNSPTSGPRDFPVGYRVCSSVATTNVSVTFNWDSVNANVDLRPGSPSTITLPSIAAGGCADAYFEVEVTPVAGAYDTTRSYHLTATDSTGTYSSPRPRQLYVEHLISQNRNSITGVKYGTTPGNLTSVPAGGSMSLLVGGTYLIELDGGTATQGYNQFEAFINLPNTIFRINSVSTTYSADNSPYVPNPNDKLYANACGWDADPNSPTYRSCTGGDFKAGGSTVVTTYNVTILSGGGTSQTLNTLLYDFSGSSYHYNADFSTGARIANIIDPTSAGISKAFTPNPAPVSSTATLTITLTNPNGDALSGYNFTDPLPAGMTVAATPNASTSGCGTPTLTAVAGSTSLSFANGTVAGGGSCVIKVDVTTPASTGTSTNTTNHLFVGSVDTGKTATANLTVNSAPPAGTGVCNVTLASTSVPPGSTNPPTLTRAADVSAATLAASIPADTQIAAAGHNDTASWQTYGYKNDGNTLTFSVDTTNYSNVKLTFWMANPSPANGPTSVAFSVSTNGGGFTPLPAATITSPAQAFTQYTIDLSSVTGTTSASPRTTAVRMTPTGANSDAQGASLNLDDIAFTGCHAASNATIAKSFSPTPIAVNGTSTLTITLTNPNTQQLTGAAFTDSLPSGVQVAATPNATTTCAGATWAPAAGATSLTFSGGTIPASGSCTASVAVTATTAGPHTNVTGFVSTTESGTNTTSTGSSTLTALQPPAIAKRFLSSPILAGATSRLVFTITNPNQNDAISGVAFADTFPASPGAMTVAATPNASTSGCGAPVFSPAAGAGSISFTGGSIAAGGTCTVAVDVTASTTGTYNNTSGNVSYVVNAQTINGNTASAALTVGSPNPSVGLLKEVSTSSSGPWRSFDAITSGTPVYYRFTLENTGDVPLTNVTITDNTLDVSSCNASFAGMTLPVAVAANENHIVTCVVGPVTTASGSHPNIASASGTYNAAPYTSRNDTAIYATTGLTLDKTATETSYATAGDLIHYSYLVSNTGFAPLAGPVTVADNRVTVSCPSTTTVGDLDNFLDPGESVTCTATYTVTGADVTAGSVTNVATASADGVTSPSDSVTVNGPAAPSADVSLTKTLNTAGPYAMGQSISYTIVVANAGPSTATNVLVQDTPTNLTITNVTGGGCSALSCTIPSIAVGANVTITVTATINANGAFDNSATATATQFDPNTANNTDNTGNG